MISWCKAHLRLVCLCAISAIVALFAASYFIPAVGEPIIWTLQLVNTYRGFTTAVGTAVIAAFTATLYWSSVRQGDLTQQIIKLARDEFAAAHPPEFVVREVRLTWVDEADNAKPVIAFTLINRGRSAGTVVESVLRRGDDWVDMPLSEGRNDIGSLRLIAGQYRFVNVPLLGDGGAVLVEATDMGVFENQIFGGVVVYEDDDGVRRRMVFKRLCVRDSGRGFLATGLPGDEYTD